MKSHLSSLCRTASLAGLNKGKAPDWAGLVFNQSEQTGLVEKQTPTFESESDWEEGQACDGKTVFL